MEFPMHRRTPNNVTRKWFRAPLQNEKQHAYARLAEFIAELDTTAHAAEPPDIVQMEWRAYSYATLVLETTALPTDRYRDWLQYGESDGLGDCDRILAALNISRARRQTIISALSNTEAYPSRKPVAGYQIGRVLQNAGIVPIG